jgi:enterochelin esterase-like enzyme
MGKQSIIGYAWMLFFVAVLCLPASSIGSDPCCPLTEELRYLLQPSSEVRFPYQVRHEKFFSASLGKEKNFFLVLPPDFDPQSAERYPLLILLHGYDFHRNGGGTVCDPKSALDILCREAEEEYHWLLWEEIAPIAAAMMAEGNKTYKDLKEDLQARFEELAHYGGLGTRDYSPADIAVSLVEHNLHPFGGIDDPFQPIRTMIILLPDGDNSFYADEDKGKNLFPPTNNKGACDVFSPEECLRIINVPRRYMRPGALGRYESYVIELIDHLRNESSLKGKLLPPPHTGIGGFSMGGFGALQIALRHPILFSSVSSQSGLVDIELLTNKVVLKTTMPEFLEVFGYLAPLALPSRSTINEAYRREHNPVRLIREGRGKELWAKIYFDYGAGERFDVIREGNKRLEQYLDITDRMIPVQPYNGNAEHNYLFWRSRLGNVLDHHSRCLR